MGNWVEVRQKKEILATLDEKGQVEGLPFMPEMFAYCGQRFRVYKRAHKTCDTVNDYKARRMNGAVHLDGVRCNGASHGGCQAGCLIFWKEIWLRGVSDFDAGGENKSKQLVEKSEKSIRGCTEAEVEANATILKDGVDGPTYVCQATQLPSATEPLPWWQLRQYIEDYVAGNVRLGAMVGGFAYMSYGWLINLGIGLGEPLRWLYDVFQRFHGGLPHPNRRGRVPVGERTPEGKLDLQPGEWIRVKSYDEILATCTRNRKNRGLSFDVEMVPYCGGTFQVLKRVNRIVDERTGRMLEIKTPSIILDGVVCQARYSKCRLFCPRSIYSYWREIWLERLNENGSVPTVPGPSKIRS